MAEPKKYVRGTARMHKFEAGGYVINFTVNIEDLKEFEKDGGWVNLSMAPRKEVDNYGNTHSMYLNTFVPDKSKGGKKPNAPSAVPVPDGLGGKDEEDDLPFMISIPILLGLFAQWIVI